MAYPIQYPVFTGTKKKKAKGQGEYAFAKRLLGLTSDNPVLISSSQKEGLPFKSLGRLQEALDMSDRGIAHLLEMDAKTLSRRRKQGHLDPLESDRLLRVGRVVWIAIEVMEGDRKEAKEWLLEPNDFLGNKRPMDVINTDIGARQVEDMLGGMEWGHTA